MSDRTSGDPMAVAIASMIQDSYGLSLKRFNGMRGDKAALGVSLAEGRQSLEMITKRSLQAFNVVRKFRRLDFAGAFKELGLSESKGRAMKRGWRGTARDFASLQLEVSFGWMPFCSDLYTAAKVLSTPLAYEAATKAGNTLKRSYVNSPPPKPSKNLHEVEVRTQVGAVLTVSNPNLDLANRMGLTNPLAVVFELIPFSFVPNWFVNFEEFLGQFTEYYGVSVDRPFYSEKVQDNMSSFVLDSGSFFSQGSGLSKSFQRFVGSLPAIRLGLRPAVSMPIRRALNAISLLVQLGFRR